MILIDFFYYSLSIRTKPIYISYWYILDWDDLLYWALDR